MAIQIDTPVQFLKGVGPKFGELLRKKNIVTVGDLLEWFPRAYEDRRAARSISSLKPDELVSLKAQVVAVRSFQMGKSRRKIYDVTLRDGTGKIHCKFFRVPYKGFFERFQPNQLVRVIGKVTHYRGQIEFHHPDLQDYEDEAAHEDHDKLLPIYPETEGLGTRQVQRFVAKALEEIGPLVAAGGGRLEAPLVFDKLPSYLQERYQLVGRLEALKQVHQPPKEAGVEWLEWRSPGHRRLIFEEFFWLELFLASRHSKLQREQAPALKPKQELVEKLKALLPFQLTGAQLRAFDDILKDVAQPHPMHRLVQGDVGSGKTLVALMSCLVASANGHQSALMAPTEILAEQHVRNAQRWFEPLGIKVGLLTGSMRMSERNSILKSLQEGELDVIVGTHALIEDEVVFKKLGLVIIDEQHRFGVHQRSRLKQKGLSPHFLVMTATPIPRTLAMTVYGDLDVSVINEMPPGRTPIVTRTGYEKVRTKLMQFLKEQLIKGRQAYVVYPLVEESEKIDLKDAVSAFEKLKTELVGFEVGLLHGKMRPDEKEQVMTQFRAGQIKVLVSTTVIEVGVDVPNANLMIIEHAERFGLSQLHQLRGRVGRGSHRSYCILMLGHAVSDEGRERARIMESTTDGFKIAEADLEMRGPGEFMGSRQSGLPGFRLANLVRDVEILAQARQAAFEVFKSDPSLSRPEHRSLRDELLRAHGPTALASVG